MAGRRWALRAESILAASPPRRAREWVGSRAAKLSKTSPRACVRARAGAPENDNHRHGHATTGRRLTRERIASAPVSALHKMPPRWLLPLVAIVAGAALLWAIAGVGFVNYDTLYALAWGGQLSRGSVPAYEVPIAPTPHPLVEAIGVVLAPLGAHGAIAVTVALAFLALAGCAWVIYALGAHWFGRAAGALAALIFVTRVPVLSYGVRAYIDIPYLLLVLGAVLVEMRRPRAGAPAAVLALLTLAGLLRPEAWAFAGLYWLYLLFVGGRSRGQLARLALLAASAPLVWILSDLLVTGKPLWSLTNTRHTAQILDRYTGIANVPEYIPRRIGEILRPPVLVGAALGGVLSLLWLRDRARPGAGWGRSRWWCSRRSPPWACRSTPAMRFWRRPSCACSAAWGCSAGRSCRGRTAGDDGGGRAA